MDRPRAGHSPLAMVVRANAVSAAFETAYRAHFGFVWRALRRHGVPDAALDDATQEVFLVAHRQWGAWEGRATMRAWLFGVVRRVASTQHRTRSRHETKLRALPSPPPDPSLDDRLDDRGRVDRLAQAIAGLPEERRDVFVLGDVEGLAAPEIAAALGCKLNTVYSRLRRARDAVARAMSAPGVSAPNDQPKKGHA